MNKPKTPGIVTIAISTTITIVFWIFIALYQILISNTEPVVDPNLLKQIDPVLDTTLLKSLNNKVYFEKRQSQPPLPVNLEIINQVQASPTEIPAEPLLKDANTPVSTEEAELEF